MLFGKTVNCLALIDADRMVGEAVINDYWERCHG